MTDHPADVQDISALGYWTVSSQKVGFGIECLSDDRVRRTTTTPHNPAISKEGCHTRSCFQDLQELRLLQLEEPVGWISVKVDDETTGQPLRTTLIQVAILTNHQNGKDTHVRQLKVFHDSMIVGNNYGLARAHSLVFEACIPESAARMRRVLVAAKSLPSCRSC
ncbi:Anaphase-promoting complex subunit 10 [Blyttiomyces sp. JEL0837]|nr:Anaphase-promoting complex subunit 10 [Blyttiomyces sp. JEL0837]